MQLSLTDYAYLIYGCGFMISFWLTIPVVSWQWWIQRGKSGAAPIGLRMFVDKSPFSRIKRI